MKLLNVEPSPIRTKKWRATFDDGTKTDFGARGMKDYTQHHDEHRRSRYIKRHIKDLDTRDPTRAGYLSMFLLWGNYTSLEKNIKAYKELFHL